MFVAMTLYFYFFGLTVGVPILFFNQKLKNQTLAAFAATATLIMVGPVVVAMIAWYMNGSPSLYEVAYFVALFGLGGALAGYLYWWIAKRRRPQDVTQEIFG